LNLENKLGVLVVRNFTQTIQFARKTIYHCWFQFIY